MKLKKLLKFLTFTFVQILRFLFNIASKFIKSLKKDLIFMNIIIFMIPYFLTRVSIFNLLLTKVFLLKL